MAIDMTTVKQIMHNNKEVAKIEDGLGNTLWQKAAPQEYYLKDGNYYINKKATGTSTLERSTTPTTVWQTETDNRVYCLVDGNKRYLNFTLDSANIYHCYIGAQLSSDFYWVYKNGNYITGTYEDTTLYLYTYNSSTSAVRMHIEATTLTFEPVSQ